MIYLALLDSPRERRRAAARRHDRQVGRALIGVGIVIAGLVGLGITFALVYGPDPWRPVLLGVGMPLGLIGGCGSLSATVVGCVIVVDALRKARAEAARLAAHRS